MTVRVLDPAKPEAGLSLFAGSVGVQTIGAGQGIAVNAPAGLALAPDGQRLVFTEVGGSVVKQLVGGQVTVVAGGRTAAWTDGGPALTAGLVGPAAVAFDRAGNLWIAETTMPRLLKVTPEGAMLHMAGTGKSLDLSGKNLTFDPAGKAAKEVQLGRPVSLAIGPDDRPYWVDQGFNVVCRLTADNRVEVVVGQAPARYAEGGDAGDEGPASAARLNFPTGLAFDRAGAMYLTDSLNFKLRRVDLVAQPPTIRTIGGLGLAATALALLGGAPTPESGKPLSGQPLVAPAGLHVDAKNRLYLVEGGTVRLTSLINGLSATQVPAGLPLVPARIRRIDLSAPDMPVTTIAGPGGRVLTETRGDQVLGLPLGLAIDASGRLIIADGLNNQIRLVPNAALD
jgi:sugar lactone lactonase YvrE